MYQDCSIDYVIDGRNFRTPPDIYHSTAHRERHIGLDDDAYNGEGAPSSQTQSDTWGADLQRIFGNIVSVTETVNSPTSWVAEWRWFSAFSYSGTLKATFNLSGRINPADIHGPLFAAVDAYQLSAVPLFRAVKKGFNPISGTLFDEPLYDPTSGHDAAGTYYPPPGNPTDGSGVAVASNQFAAHAGISNTGRFADGEYGPPLGGNRAEPMALGYVVWASKTIEWNPSLVCQVQKLTTWSFPNNSASSTTQESCGQIGGTVEQNAQGVLIARPPFYPGEDLFYWAGYYSMLRERDIFYHDPFYGTLPNPPCCGFPTI